MSQTDTTVFVQRFTHGLIGPDTGFFYHHSQWGPDSGRHPARVLGTHDYPRFSGRT